jgi:protein associated with RNAse G/E
MRVIQVDYRKYDNSPHWRQTMYMLGEDDHGTWLGAPANAVVHKGLGRPSFTLAEPRVLLCPRDAWWTATFISPPARLEIYCDITTPPEWPTPSDVTMVDLDLDVCRTRRDQRVELLDEDEFAEHQLGYGYSTDVIGRATESARWLVNTITAGTEPFGRDYRRWLAAIAGD